jgi:hypothetical protein
MEVQSKYYRATEMCIEHLIRLAKMNSHCLKWLHEHSSQLKFMTTFLNVYSRPPTYSDSNVSLLGVELCLSVSTSVCLCVCVCVCGVSVRGCRVPMSSHRFVCLHNGFRIQYNLLTEVQGATLTRISCLWNFWKGFPKSKNVAK